MCRSVVGKKRWVARTAGKAIFAVVAIRSNRIGSMSGFEEYKIIIESGLDGYFVAHTQSLPGCWSQGKTVEEATAILLEAIDLYREPETRQNPP